MTHNGTSSDNIRKHLDILEFLVSIKDILTGIDKEKKTKQIHIESIQEKVIGIKQWICHAGSGEQNLEFGIDTLKLIKKKIIKEYLSETRHFIEEPCKGRLF